MKISLTGKNMDRIPGLAFRMMRGMFAFRDRFVSVGSLLNQFGITRGQTVVDYGCGPGSYLKRASELVGPEGRVLAVDIHELAIETVEKRLKREGLMNVTPLLTDGKTILLPDDTADLIYALDMFHMVSAPEVMLTELNRICKEEGFLFIDNGHQSRQEAKSKIERSGQWRIVDEKKRYMVCRPVKSGQDQAA
ncbi:MAG: class I SAM-dependent methyltransferase [Thermodesulfobacteriota bacterium]